MEGRSKARDHSVVGNSIRVNLTRWGGARDQFSVHEIVHIFTVLAVLPGEALLNGPCGGEVGDAAIPGEREYKNTFGDTKSGTAVIDICILSIAMCNYTYFLLCWHNLFPSQP